MRNTTSSELLLCIHHDLICSDRASVTKPALYGPHTSVAFRVAPSRRGLHGMTDPAVDIKLKSGDGAQARYCVQSYIVH